MAVPNNLNPIFYSIGFQGGTPVILSGTATGSATILALTGTVGNGSIYLTCAGTSGEVWFFLPAPL